MLNKSAPWRKQTENAYLEHPVLLAESVGARCGHVVRFVRVVGEVLRRQVLRDDVADLRRHLGRRVAALPPKRQLLPVLQHRVLELLQSHTKHSVSGFFTLRYGSKHNAGAHVPSFLSQHNKTNERVLQRANTKFTS